MHSSRSRVTGVTLLLTLASLAACDRTTPAAAPSPSAAGTPTSQVLAKVAALPPGQRDGVLFRAIRDAGHDCQAITEVKPQPADAGTLAWLAMCDGREQWLVSMDSTGTAIVVGAKAAAAAARAAH